MYERGNFLWIGSDDFRTGDRIFADVPRAIGLFKTARIQDRDSNIINVPLDVNKFLFDYAHSTFIECNEDLARANLKLTNYTQNIKKNAIISKTLNYMSTSLESYYKNYWLAGGTLLGKTL